MRSKQRGVTFLGWVVLLIPIGLVVYVAIRLTPLYLNYMAVSKAIDGIAQETRDAGTVNKATIQTGLFRRFDIEGITVVKPDDFTRERQGDATVGRLAYEEVVPIIANVSLLVQFNKQVNLQ